MLSIQYHHHKCKEENDLKHKNMEVRTEIEKSGFRYWQVADEIGIRPETLCIWLRHELTGERLERVQAAIAALNSGKVVVE